MTVDKSSKATEALRALKDLSFTKALIQSAIGGITDTTLTDHMSVMRVRLIQLMSSSERLIPATVQWATVQGNSLSAGIGIHFSHTHKAHRKKVTQPFQPSEIDWASFRIRPLSPNLPKLRRLQIVARIEVQLK